jgi:hypothetical protein
MKCFGEFYAFNDVLICFKNAIPVAYASDILTERMENFKILNYSKRDVCNIGPVHGVVISQERA